MICLIDLYRLLQALLPELRQRLRASRIDEPLRPLRLTACDQSAVLSVGQDGELTVDEAIDQATDSAFVELSGRDLVSLVLGLSSWPEVALSTRHNLSPAEQQFLSALFPRQATATGLWG